MTGESGAYVTGDQHLHVQDCKVCADFNPCIDTQFGCSEPGCGDCWPRFTVMPRSTDA